MQPAEDDREQRTALGKAIVIRRTELGLTRNDLRDRSGLSYPYVAELEKGSKRMSASSLQAVSDALEVRPAELLAMADSLVDSEMTSGPPTATAKLAAPVDTASAREGASPPAPVASPDLWASARAATQPYELPDPGSRWFRARQAKQRVRERVAELSEDRDVAVRDAAAAADVKSADMVAPPPSSPAAAPAKAELPVEVSAATTLIDDVDAMLALADQRIRAIVRDELRKAGIEPGP